MFVWGSEDVTALDNDWLVPGLILGLSVPKKSDNWFVNLNFDQYLYMPKQKSGIPHSAAFDFVPEGIGVFFRFAYTPEDRMKPPRPSRRDRSSQ